MNRGHRLALVMLVVWMVLVVPMVRQTLRDSKAHQGLRLVPPVRLDAVGWTVHRDPRGRAVRRDLPVRRMK